MSGLHFDSQKKKQQGKPDAGKPHVRFDEGEASRPFRGGNLSTLLENSPFYPRKVAKSHTDHVVCGIRGANR